MREVSRWLDSVPTHIDFEKHKNGRHKDTCDWILQNSTFEKWISDGFPLLWVNSIPGAGKTFLLARCIELLEDYGTVAYFFCDTKEQRKRTLEGVVRTWVWQLLQETPGRLPQLADIYFKGESPNKSNLAEALRVFLRRDSPCWLVLDGLDECEPKVRAELLEIYGSIVHETKLLIASRNENDIAQWFSKLDSGLHKTIRIDPSDNGTDIKRYLDSKIKDMNVGDDELEMEISTKLSEGAKGMFLWVVLMIEELSSQDTTEELEESLENLPERLEDIYAQVLDRINSLKDATKQRARQLLQLIACASEPLSVVEIEHCMAISYDEDQFNRRRLIRNPKDFILQCCGPLVEIGSSDSIVRMAHASVKDFLLSQSQSASISTYLVDSKEAHFRLARSCLTYLSYKNNDYVTVNEDGKASLANLDKRMQESPFLRYATSHWWRHTLATPIVNGLEKTLGKFLTSESIAVYWLQIFHRLFGDSEGVSHSGPNPNVPFFFSYLLDIRDSWQEVSSEKSWVDKMGQAGEGRAFRW